MSVKYWATREFQRLKSRWYRKLIKAGFEDIENEHGLKDYTYQLVKGYSEEKLNYYRLCDHVLHNYEFKCDLNKMIWALHTKGIPMRQIEDHIKRHGADIKKSAISKRIAKIRQEEFAKIDLSA